MAAAPQLENEPSPLIHTPQPLLAETATATLGRTNPRSNWNSTRDKPEITIIETKSHPTNFTIATVSSPSTSSSISSPSSSSTSSDSHFKAIHASPLPFRRRQPQTPPPVSRSCLSSLSPPPLNVQHSSEPSQQIHSCASSPTALISNTTTTSTTQKHDIVAPSRPRPSRPVLVVPPSQNRHRRRSNILAGSCFPSGPDPAAEDDDVNLWSGRKFPHDSYRSDFCNYDDDDSSSFLNDTCALPHRDTNSDEEGDDSITDHFLSSFLWFRKPNDSFPLLLDSEDNDNGYINSNRIHQDAIISSSWNGDVSSCGNGKPAFPSFATSFHNRVRSGSGNDASIAATMNCNTSNNQPTMTSHAITSPNRTGAIHPWVKFIDDDDDIYDSKHHHHQHPLDCYVPMDIDESWSD